MCPHSRHRRPSSSHSWAISQLSTRSPRHHPVPCIPFLMASTLPTILSISCSCSLMLTLCSLHGVCGIMHVEYMKKWLMLYTILSFTDNEENEDTFSYLQGAYFRDNFHFGWWSIKCCSGGRLGALCVSLWRQFGMECQTPSNSRGTDSCNISSVIFVLCVWSSSRFQTATDDSHVSSLAFLKEIQDLAEDIFETMDKAKSLQKLWLKRSETSGKILKRYPWFWGSENPLCYQLLSHLGEGAPPAGQGQHCLLLGRVELDPSSLGGIRGTKEELANRLRPTQFNHLF